MTYKQLEQRAHQIANEGARMGASYSSALQAMYEVACEENRLEKAHMILELIHEDIHADDDQYELAHD